MDYQLHLIRSVSQCIHHLIESSSAFCLHHTPVSSHIKMYNTYFMACTSSSRTNFFLVLVQSQSDLGLVKISSFQHKYKLRLGFKSNHKVPVQVQVEPIFFWFWSSLSLILDWYLTVYYDSTQEPSRKKDGTEFSHRETLGVRATCTGILWFNL